MKKIRVRIEFEIKGDLDDEDTLKEDIHQHLQELMDLDELYEHCEFNPDEDDEFLDNEYGLD